MRKDSATKGGSLGLEARLDSEETRIVPESFDSLPPLEQRRQTVSIFIDFQWKGRIIDSNFLRKITKNDKNYS